jgi:hypothetical protein
VKTLLTTREAASAIRARLRAELGLPRVATEADRVGGGVHVPLELCVTTEAVEALERDGVVEVLVPPALEARLTKAERGALAPLAASPAIDTDTGRVP